MSDSQGRRPAPLTFLSPEELKRMPENSDMDCMTRRPALRFIRGLVDRVQRRLGAEEGFTLVELTIVLLILGILLTIAVPSYLSFKDRAAKTAAKADVGQAMRSVMSYGADNYPNAASDPDLAKGPSGLTDSGYEGIDLTALSVKYDSSISTVAGAPFVIDPSGWNGNVTSPSDFCMTATVGRWIAVQHGPGSAVDVGTLFTPGTCTVS
jgi:prepilin-type N-terminal cleavage/methylation domain-containing protein